jgi:hypothetical protein
MSWKASAGLRLPEATAGVIASLGEHRVLSTAQVRAIHFPDRSPRRAQQVLAYLERAGLVAYVEARRAPRRLWFLTDRGADFALDAGDVSADRRSSAPSKRRGRCTPIPSASTRSGSASCARRGSAGMNSGRFPGGTRSPIPSTGAVAALAAR